MEYKEVARYEAKGGKTWASVQEFMFDGKPCYQVESVYGYCNVGNSIHTLEEAISFLENFGMLKYMKMDYVSLKRVK